MTLASMTPESLQHKTILVTGCTGFLAKVFVEKLLRFDVKRLFLLLRAVDTTSASQRLQNDVMSKEVFDVLRKKHGKGFDPFISGTVAAVAGDVSQADLGVSDEKQVEEMWKEIDVIVHVAANTKFDERYDVAIGTNTMGAKHVLEFAKKCIKLEVLLHVSTAYVAGEKTGLILEKPFSMGETLNGRTDLDIGEERKLAKEKLMELRANNATHQEERLAMKKLGLERARFFGWPNTYVFTKAMGEMLLGHTRGNVPLLVLRPTVITGTYEEPFPGWIEGPRTIDIIVDYYGKGKLKFFLGDPNTIIDIIPADMVVNAMLVMIANSNRSLELVHHMGSSNRNPVKYSFVRDCAFKFFSTNPCIAKDNTVIQVRRRKFLRTMSAFRQFMILRYKIPLEGLRIASAVGIFRRDTYNALNRMYNSLLHLFSLYRPYCFFKGRFDDINMQKLRVSTKTEANGSEKLNFDPKCIDWEDYLVNVHIPGLVRHTF